MVPQATADRRARSTCSSSVNTTGVPDRRRPHRRQPRRPVYQQASSTPRWPSTNRPGRDCRSRPTGSSRRRRSIRRTSSRTTPPVADLPGGATPVELTFSTTTSTRDRLGRHLPVHVRRRRQRRLPAALPRRDRPGGRRARPGRRTTYLPSITAPNTRAGRGQLGLAALDRPHRLARRRRLHRRRARRLGRHRRPAVPGSGGRRERRRRRAAHPGHRPGAAGRARGDEDRPVRRAVSRRQGRARPRGRRGERLARPARHRAA